MLEKGAKTDSKKVNALAYLRNIEKDNKKKERKKQTSLSDVEKEDPQRRKSALLVCVSERYFN